MANPPIKADAKASANETRSRETVTAKLASEAKPPIESEAKPETSGHKLPEIYDKQGEINTDFALAIQSTNPQALKKGGLKALQEIIHGHRERLEPDENNRLKDLLKELRRAMRKPVAAIVEQADSAEITKDTTTMDNIKRCGSRMRMIKLENETDYQLIG